MAQVTFNLNVDRFEREVLIEIFEGPAFEYTIALGKRVKARTQELIRERAEENTEGGLADSIFGTVPERDAELGWTTSISSNLEHAIWFEEGTGLFGPRNAFIRPRLAKAMVFRHRQLGRVVYAQKVKGQEGKHPFRDAMAEFDGLV